MLTLVRVLKQLLTLLPLVSVLNSFLVIFFGIVIGLEVAIAKDQAFIRNNASDSFD